VNFGTSSDWGLYLGNGTTALFPRFQFTNTGSDSLISSVAVVRDQWSHIAVTRSAGTARIFINGVQTGTVNASTWSLTNVLQKGIGGGFNGNASTLVTGYISNLRVVGGTAIYTANFTPPTAPLTAVTNTRLLTCQTAQPSNNSQFLDSSSNSFVLSRLGNTTQGSFSPYGGSWSNFFDGTGDYLSLTPNSSLTLDGDYTIELWVYFTSLDTAERIPVNCWNTGAGWLISTQSNAWNFKSAGSFTLTYSAVAPAAGQWYHVAATRSGSATNNVKFFINGVQVAQGTNTSTLTPAASSVGCVIGGGQGGSGQLITGHISNFRLVKGTAVYTANFTPPNAPLQPITGTGLLTCADNRFVDDSINNFAITRNGDVRVDKFSPFGIQTAMTPVSHSGFFDGSGDFLTMPATSPAIFAFGTNNFTIETWIYFNDVTTSQNIYESRPDAGEGLFPTIYISSGTIKFYTNSANRITSSSVVVGQWYHLAVSKSSGSTKMFLNGTQVGSSYADTNTYINGSAFRPCIATYSSSSGYLNGYLSNLRVLNGTGLYTTTFTPPTTPLTAIANTSLLTCQSSTFVDNSTNRFTITAAGDARPTQVNPFGFTTGTRTNYTPQVFGGSMSFDGTGDYLSSTSNAAIGTGPFTIEGWIYPTALGTNRSIVVNSYWNIGDNGGYRLTLTSSNTLQLQASTGTYNTFPAVITSSTALPSANQWYHFAIVRNSSNSIMIYINGVVAATAVTYASSLNLGGGQTLKIGGVISDGGLFEPFLGYISNVRVLSGTAIYPSSFVPPVAPVEHVPNTVVLLNGTSAAISDVSTLNNLETVGDARSEQFGPYNAGYYSNFFDGNGDFLSVPITASNSIGTGDFTMEAWVYPTSTLSGWNDVIVLRPGSAGILFNSGVLTAYSLGGSGSGTNVVSTYTAVLNTWQHVAITRSAGTLRIFANGVQVGSGASTVSINFDGTTSFIGSWPPGNSEFFPGYISNLRLVRNTALYTANFTPSTQPLTAIAGTILLTCQSNRFIDNSTNNFAITRGGDTRVQTQNPFQNNSGQSYYFDGTGDYLVTYSPAANQSIAFGTGSFTVEFWFNASSNAGSQQLFDTRPTGQSSTSQYIALTYLSGSLNYYTATANPAISGGAVTAGVWNHVALSRSGTSTRLFVNGVQVGSTYTDSQNYLGSINRPIIATDGNSPNTANFTGFISDLRITRGVARYTANFTPPTAAFKTK
jgi:hypothetical protein